MADRKFMLLSQIRTDGGTQARASIRPEVVDEYAESISAGTEMPPAVVFQDEAGIVWMADGFHRHAASAQAGKNSMHVEVRNGTRTEALVFAASANETHGLRRSKEDRRQAVLMLFAENMKYDHKWTQGQIGEIAHVSQTLVSKVLSEKREREDQAANNLLVTPPDGAQSRNPAAGLIPPPKVEGIRCSRCTRKGLSGDNCSACKEMRDRAAQGKKPRKRKKRSAPAARGVVKDRTGAAVPDHLRDVFADTQLQEMIATLEGIQSQFQPEPWVKKAGKLCDHYGFILIEKFNQYIFDAVARLQLAIEALSAGVPHAVCPRCKGVDSKKDGKCCRGCRGFGAVPQHRYGELAGA